MREPSQRDPRSEGGLRGVRHRGCRRACDRNRRRLWDRAGDAAAGSGRPRGRWPRQVGALAAEDGGRAPWAVIWGARMASASRPGRVACGGCYVALRGPSDGSGVAAAEGGRRGAPGPLGRARCGVRGGGRKRVLRHGRARRGRLRCGHRRRAAGCRVAGRGGVTRGPPVRPSQACGCRRASCSAAGAWLQSASMYRRPDAPSVPASGAPSVAARTGVRWVPGGAG